MLVLQQQLAIILEVSMSQQYNRPVGDIINVGPFYAGDTGPSLNIILSYDSGGYVDITNTNIEGKVRRWDPRRKQPLGPIVTTLTGIIADAGKGSFTINWEYGDPISSIPTTSGWYTMQIELLFPTGITQNSQRFIFEVLSK